MKYRVLAAAAAVATALTGVASVSAQPPGHERVVVTRTHTEVRHTEWNNGRHEGWDRGRHEGWDHGRKAGWHHNRQVCRNMWRHHHHERVCTTQHW